MKRIRLTQRVAKNLKADEKYPETSIDLGKDRKYHKIDEYHTFEQTVNHELPDMRHEWQDNPRTETGHGIPKMASVYRSAKKATRLAVALLGKNASDKDVHAQACAFMRMGDRALTASLERLTECEECKDSDDENTAETTAEGIVTDLAPAEETAPAEGIVTDLAPVEETAPAEKNDEAIETIIEENIPSDGEFDTTVVAPEGDESIVTFDDDGDESLPAESDSDLHEALGFDEYEDLSGEGEETSAPVEKKPAEACRKAGIKRLSGQPTLVRVASKKADDLAGLWDF